MSSRLKAELAATCSTLGRMHKGEYLIEPECIESVKDLIRYLKRDGVGHDIRSYLGEAKVLQNDLIHIVKSCPEERGDLFDVTLRLLINLTTPALLFYGEEVPSEKVARNVYLNLVGYGQEYKLAFCDVEFWNKVCGKLTVFFERDWTERSAEDGIQIERILMLLRNVLQVPADVEEEKRPENDITVHDKVLWALRQSQILELLLFVSSNKNEEPYYLNLLEIFSLILREQNPKLLGRLDLQHSMTEKEKESEELVRVREAEKKNRNKYQNMRNFNTTFIMRGVKSLSNNDVVCHKSLEKVTNFEAEGKKAVRLRRNRIPVESERIERRSTFSVRLFLKEFSLEFLNCSLRHLMNVVKCKLDSGKSLANDQTYYLWALKFFLDFATASDSDVNLIQDFLTIESFHFVQTSMENAFEHLQTEKKKTVEWVRRIHLILKVYWSLLETLLWMDLSKSPLTRSKSRELKSQIFYVVEYREMTLHLLLRYDSAKFSVPYLRDLVETTHLFVKLLEEYTKQTKLVAQKITRKKQIKKRSKEGKQVVETHEEKWEKIKDDVYDTLCSGETFPEIPPFDAALEIPIDDQKGSAMKRIQAFLHDGKISDSIGLLRCARQVWPENDHFGTEVMSVEDETLALQEICLAPLGEMERDDKKKDSPFEEEESEEVENKTRILIVEHNFDIMDYKKRLVNKKIVESCGILLRNYRNNSDHTNHCAIKLLHRIGWECSMPALLFQASLFWTLFRILRDKSRNYSEINIFTLNLMRKFRKHASQNVVVFLELLFWKENSVALEIQHVYGNYEKIPKLRKKSKDRKSDDEREIPKRKKSLRKTNAEKGKMKKKIGEIFTQEKKSLVENVSSVPEILLEETLEICEDQRSSDSKEENVNTTTLGMLRDELEEEAESETYGTQSELKRFRVFNSYEKVLDQSNQGLRALGGISEREKEISDCDEKAMENGREGKKNTWHSRSQKREREGRKSIAGSANSDRKKLKRIRCTGFNTDTEDCDSENEAPNLSKIKGIAKNRKRRLAVIDSDSD